VLAIWTLLRSLSQQERKYNSIPSQFHRQSGSCALPCRARIIGT
jgi:hypothetical protein